VVSVGQEVNVKIIKIEKEGDRTRISLSLKQTTPKEMGSDPWMKIAEKFPVGTVVKGVIEKREVFGLFVKIGEGVTGLLHKSKAIDHPEFHLEKARPGQELTVQVSEIRPAERRISLDFPREDGGDWQNYSPEAKGSFGGAFGAALKNAIDKKKK
jgi:small subunit ribosomal protein S1